MCIIEYVGYSCGHSSVPVLRLCPMTTHALSNPVCKDPSHRPTMVGDMCPACSRVIHSRWVDIVMFEHQWMHKRGTCGCPTKFPSLLHPRTMGADSNREADQYTGQTTLRGISDRIGEAISKKLESGDGTAATSYEDNVGSATATAFVDRPSVGGPSRPGRGNGKKKTHKPVKQKGKGKGKGWIRKQHYKNNNPELGRHAMMATHHDATTTLLPRLATLSSDDEVVETFQLPSLESSSTTDGIHSASDGPPLQQQQQGQQVNVRLASQFAAEWIPDHAERHRTGACSCHVRFERYQPYEVTEAEYYFGRADSQGSSISYLDHMTAGMEALGFSEPGGCGGNSSDSGGGSTAIIPTTTTIQDVEGTEGLFFHFSSPSPQMTMSSSGDTGYGSMGFSPDFTTLNTAAVYDNTTDFATAPPFGPDTGNFDSMPMNNSSSYMAAQDDYNTCAYNCSYTTPAQTPPATPITATPRSPILYSYPPEQALRPMDIAHWRVIEASPDPARSWAVESRNRPEDFGFRSVDEAARVLAQTPAQAPIRSRLAAPVAAADHLPNTLYYQHFDADDPSTYPIVALPLGAGPEGGPEYSHSPRWDVCHLARPRPRRSRSLDGRT
ncbi:hypothetical protein PG994_011391 [Apiospora phragmitis]|uniref:Uncharacterized protein n=1 Tax=Apiospora phragmitis TaxID=2905665 RepID=A0ABR1TSQ5_9PEZI